MMTNEQRMIPERLPGKRVDEIEIRTGTEWRKVEVRLEVKTTGRRGRGDVEGHTFHLVQREAFLIGQEKVEFQPFVVIETGRDLNRYGRGDSPWNDSPDIILDVRCVAFGVRGDVEVESDVTLLFDGDAEATEKVPESVAEAMEDDGDSGDGPWKPRGDVPPDPLDRKWEGRWKYDQRHVKVRNTWPSTEEKRGTREDRLAGLPVKTVAILPATEENVEAARELQRRVRDLQRMWGSYLAHGDVGFLGMMLDFAPSLKPLMPPAPRPDQCCPDCGAFLGGKMEYVDFERRLEQHQSLDQCPAKGKKRKKRT